MVPETVVGNPRFTLTVLKDCNNQYRVISVPKKKQILQDNDIALFKSILLREQPHGLLKCSGWFCVLSHVSPCVLSVGKTCYTLHIQKVFPQCGSSNAA